MSAPTRTRRRGNGTRLSARQRDDLIVQAELALVDAEIQVIEHPGNDEAMAELRAAEQELQQLYVEHRIPCHRYTSALAGLLVIDVEKAPLQRMPGGLRASLEAELARREASIWDGIAEMATRPGGERGGEC